MTNEPPTWLHNDELDDVRRERVIDNVNAMLRTRAEIRALSETTERTKA